MKDPDWKCSHHNTWYRDGSLMCSDCNKTGLEQYLEEDDFPATFKNVFEDKDTGFSVDKINNHVEKYTFFRSFNVDLECVLTTRDLVEALQAGAPRLVKLD